VAFEPAGQLREPSVEVGDRDRQLAFSELSRGSAEHDRSVVGRKAQRGVEKLDRR
jgi:hypothetical protein